MYGYHWMGGMWLVGLVCMAAFVALVIWLYGGSRPRSPVIDVLWPPWKSDTRRVRSNARSSSGCGATSLVESGVKRGCRPRRIPPARKRRADATEAQASTACDPVTATPCKRRHRVHSSTRTAAAPRTGWTGAQ